MAYYFIIVNFMLADAVIIHDKNYAPLPTTMQLYSVSHLVNWDTGEQLIYISYSNQQKGLWNLSEVKRDNILIVSSPDESHAIPVAVIYFKVDFLNSW